MRDLHGLEEGLLDGEWLGVDAVDRAQGRPKARPFRGKVIFLALPDCNCDGQGRKGALQALDVAQRADADHGIHDSALLGLRELRVAVLEARLDCKRFHAWHAGVRGEGVLQNEADHDQQLVIAGVAEAVLDVPAEHPELEASSRVVLQHAVAAEVGIALIRHEERP
eukprot:15462899-Alexandrium_andersonii.AAC.1